MFLGDNKKLTPKVFSKAISSSYFAPGKKETSAEKAKRVKDTTEIVFAKYDPTNNGHLAFEDFKVWAANSVEGKSITDIFVVMDRQLTQSTGLILPFFPN